MNHRLSGSCTFVLQQELDCYSSWYSVDVKQIMNKCPAGSYFLPQCWTTSTKKKKIRAGAHMMHIMNNGRANLHSHCWCCTNRCAIWQETRHVTALIPPYANTGEHSISKSRQLCSHLEIHACICTKISQCLVELLWMSGYLIAQTIWNDSDLCLIKKSENNSGYNHHVAKNHQHTQWPIMRKYVAVISYTAYTINLPIEMQ